LAPPSTGTAVGDVALVAVEVDVGGIDDRFVVEVDVAARCPAAIVEGPLQAHRVTDRIAEAATVPLQPANRTAQLY
jgi:hypothetical protein